MTEQVVGLDKMDMIRHIYSYRYAYKFAWGVLLVLFTYLVVNSMNWIGYIFLPCTPEICITEATRLLIGSLWFINLAATYFLVYTGVWILLIERIYEKNIGGKNDRRKK